MNQQDELAHFTGEINEASEPAHHPAGCLCTSCTTEQLLERGGGRFDKDIAAHLHHIRDLRELRSPRSTGSAGYRRAEVAGVAQERTVSPSPTVEEF